MTQKTAILMCSWLRRLDSVEKQTKQLCQSAEGAQDANGTTDESLKERLSGIENSLHDLGRNLQLVRDRQVR